jgi:hypothetical protein
MKRPFCGPSRTLSGGTGEEQKMVIYPVISSDDDVEMQSEPTNEMTDLLQMLPQADPINMREMTSNASRLLEHGAELLDKQVLSEDEEYERTEMHTSVDLVVAKDAKKKDLVLQGQLLDAMKDRNIGERERKIYCLKQEMKKLQHEIILIRRNWVAAKGVIRHHKIDLK